MSAFDRIKEFVVRLVRDESFLANLDQKSTPEEQEEFLQQSGYSFSPTDLDSAAIKILELAEQGKFTDLNEDELVAVFGGQTNTNNLIQPMYGIGIGPIDDLPPADPILPTPRPLPTPHYRPRHWGWWWRVRYPRQPISRKPPEAIALYGVAIPPNSSEQ
jgi:hypothetical protein